MATAKRKTVKINDKEYKLDDLSKDAKAQLLNLRICDAEIQHLKAQLAIAETARNAYLRALDANLPKKAK